MIEMTDGIPQGDILIEPVDELPEGLLEANPQDGAHVVAHSETGHHHQVAGDTARMFRDPDDPLVCYLLAEGAYADIEHVRPTNPHETVRFKNTVRITRQREWTPAGFRAVED